MSKSSKKARKSWLKGKKKQIIAVVAVVGLLVVAAVVGLAVRMVQDSGKPGEKSAPQANRANNDRGVLPSSVTDAQDLIGTGKNAEAEKQLSSDIAASSDNEEKFELYLAQGVNYENQKQYDNAVTAYKNAEAIKKTATVDSSLGRVTAAKGDKAGAISYYKQAIEQLNKSDPRYNADKTELEQIIKGLGG
jgi:tetratricopeptide (TPR) repeat protein